MIDPKKAFMSPRYQMINQVRFDHLASLGLDLTNKTVLELGAGIGDHTQFFLDRNCDVTSTEGRPENLAVFGERFPHVRSFLLDVDTPNVEFDEKFEIVYSYGLLYHLGDPFNALKRMCDWCSSLLLLETIVSYDSGKSIDYCKDLTFDPTQSVSGEACRPSRRWVFDQLKKHIDFVYMPVTQPKFKELYPLDWTAERKYPVSRAVFIASRSEIDNELLVNSVPDTQIWHE